MTSTIDYRPLSTPVDKAAVRLFQSDVTRGAYGPTRPSGASAIGAWLGAGAGVVVLLFLVQAIVRGGFYSGSEMMLLAAAAAFVAAAAVLMNRTRRWRSWCRLANFAHANGLAMQPEAPGPDYPGVIFGRGGGRTASERVYSTNGRYFDIANYRYATGSGKNRRTYRWQYLAVKLNRSLPHMVLDAQANNSLLGSNLPKMFSRDQVLSLEGDFDNHFTLYCPREYERDALYIFTPDLMAQLIDAVGMFDVEIIDDWLFLYSPNSYDPLEPAVWQRFMSIIDTVASKTVSRSDNYRDERMVPAGTAPMQAQASTNKLIAPQGRRLRSGISGAAIAIIAVAVLGWLLVTLM